MQITKLLISSYFNCYNCPYKYSMDFVRDNNLCDCADLIYLQYVIIVIFYLHTLLFFFKYVENCKCLLVFSLAPWGKVQALKVLDSIELFLSHCCFSWPQVVYFSWHFNQNIIFCNCFVQHFSHPQKFVIFWPKHLKITREIQDWPI